MLFITVIFLALAFTCSVGDKRDDTIDVLDEVLAEHLPSAIEAEADTINTLLSYNYGHQTKSPDGPVLNTKIFYHAENVTGLQNVLRNMCFEPSESSGNVSVVCHIDLPHLQVQYYGRFQSIKGFNNPFGVHIRQFDFTLDIDIKDTKVELEVTSSPSIQIPSVKRLDLESRGEISMKFHTEAANPEDVTEGIKSRFNRLFDNFISGPFRNALETSFRNVRFPKSA